MPVTGAFIRDQFVRPVMTPIDRCGVLPRTKDDNGSRTPRADGIHAAASSRERWPT